MSRHQVLRTYALRITRNFTASPSLGDAVNILGEIAQFVGIEPGHLVGSLNHVEAAKFAALCDTYISPPPAA